MFIYFACPQILPYCVIRVEHRESISEREAAVKEVAKAMAAAARTTGTKFTKNYYYNIQVYTVFLMHCKSRNLDNYFELFIPHGRY